MVQKEYVHPSIQIYIYMHTYIYVLSRERMGTNDKANGAKCYQVVNLGQEYVGILCTILVT